jgi:hypothetical protein
MMKSQESESSLTKQSNVLRLFGFVAGVGCLAAGAGALAVGLIDWDIFKLSPQVAAPVKALASTVSSSSVNSVSAFATAPQSVELIVRTNTPPEQSGDPTTSSLARMPAAEPKSEPISESNAPTPPAIVAPQEPPLNSAIATTSQDWDTPLATSGIAAASPTGQPEAEPKPPTMTPPRDSHLRHSVQNFAPTAPAHKQRSHSGPILGQRMWYK